MQKLNAPKMAIADSVPTQLLAIAQLRWWMFLNGLRSRRGKAELASRLLVTSVFAFGGFGAFAAAAGFSWYFVSNGEAQLLAILL